MKAVILAGGYGIRLSEETSVVPKPMVEIGGRVVPPNCEVVCLDETRLYDVRNSYSRLLSHPPHIFLTGMRPCFVNGCCRIDSQHAIEEFSSRGGGRIGAASKTFMNSERPFHPSASKR